MEIVVIPLVIICIVGAIVYSWYAAKKRREELFGLASKLGLGFSPGKNHDLAARYTFLDRLRKGSNRYASNIISGKYRDQDVVAFDYHYETHSTNSKGHRQTHHHYFSFFILALPKSFSELTIVKEGFLSKIAQAVGYDDIDFESHEFSRRFCVRCADKKFAYDICNAQMIEYLLDNRDLSIELESNALALAFDSRLSAQEIEHNLGRLLEVRERIPDYLFG